MQNIQTILDEFGIGFIYPLHDSNFETSRGGWQNTKWIVLSSSFFSIPVVSIFAKNSANTDATYMAKLLILTSLVSANYLRDAKRGWRRNMDLILAKVTFSTGVYYGVLYVSTGPYSIALFVSILLSLYFYNQSAKFIEKNDSQWAKYHFVFHICVTIGAAFVTEQMMLKQDLSNKPI